MARLVAPIRARWPTVRILLRGDWGFAREALIAWCEHNAVDYLFGLARNTRLVAEIEAELATTADEPEERHAGAALQGLHLDDAATAGAASAEWLPRPNGPVARPIRAKQEFG